MDFDLGHPALTSLARSPRPLTGVLNKLVHAILRAEAQEKVDDRAEVEALYRTMDLYIDSLQERIKRPNFLCVLPGKFSFFPLLAHKVYLEMEGRGLYRNAGPWTKLPQNPDPVVAKPHPVELLRATQTRSKTDERA